MQPGNAEILIVDNDDRIVELVAWFLKKRGFGVRSAVTFAEARTLIEEAAPDLMLSDVDLGAESAREELPALHDAGILPPTLVVSGYLDEELEAEFAAIPWVLDTLKKPFDFQDLEQRVLECLKKAEGLQERDELTPAAPEPAAEITPPAGSGEGWVEIQPRSSMV